MDASYAKVYAEIARNTNTFNLGDEETWRQIYEPFIPERPRNVFVVRDQRYGPAERNTLDVYYPCDDSTTGKPVLAFFHEGGFFSGDKQWSERYWGNIGNYFAQQGMVVVIANHQLVPFSKNEPPGSDKDATSIKYPAGADDVQLVREWVYHKISRPESGSGSVDKVVLFGHSSGGAHVAMNLYAAGDSQRKLPRPGIFPPVAGVIYLSVPFWYDRNRPIRQKILQRYYGSDSEEIWGPRSVLGLFQRLPDDSPVLDAIKLPTFIGTVKWEVDEAFDAAIDFLKAYRERCRPAGTNAIFHILDKHNHLSNVLSIGTKDTAQATVLRDFIRSCTTPAAEGSINAKI
ncbi:hypothetical protein FE257_002684 [Aspergillus nanangensis]|uniref:BD-FAE-like domain-containing protein n=1 Tax=Aspergillus nanangensis TaxID=2582783 RepID=A0AAD4CCD5_ASPNN|nr:hypothetical protein FE257_002684 [Aspergillus nanangensis]